ncbi:hypothetical protein SAMN06296952_2286 [Oscillospiraceae bacterium]|nr:hypothetical protein SAMN06296952_2286 [Oscillospiraceae bacterium]
MFANIPWLKKVIIIASFFCMVLLLLPSLSEGLLLSLIGGLLLFIKPDCAFTKISLKRIVSSSVIAVLLLVVYLYYLSQYNDISSISFIMSSLLYGIISVVFIYAFISLCSKADFTGVRSGGSTKVSYKYLIYALIFSVLAMLFVSQSSPLYEINYWDDSNIYHTVAKAVWNGKLLYRDIHDQKGPLMFFIQIPGVIISDDSFTGMYVIEAIAFFAWTVIVLKTVFLFVKPGIATYILIPPISLFALITNSFRYGGSAEEFMLPFLGAALYIGLRCIREERSFTLKEAFVVGIISSMVFWTKFNLCGLLLGFVIYVLIVAIREKKHKELPKLIGMFIAGFFCICIPILLYFAFKGSIKTLFDGYFLSNVSVYVDPRKGSTSDAPFIITFAKKQLEIFMENYKYEHIFFMSVFFSLIVFSARKEKKTFLFFILTLGCAYFGIFGMGFQISYYLMGLKSFMVFAMIPLFLLTEKVSDKLTVRALRPGLAVLGMLLITATVIVCSPSLFMFGREREEYPQYQIAEVIKADGIADPKIINFGFLDSGFYLATDTLPFNNHYCTACDYEYYTYEHKALIQQKAADYIITKDKTYDWEGYELIFVSSSNEMYWNGSFIEEDTFYLYRRVS